MARIMVVVLGIICLSSATAFGQVLYGNLVGNVTDPQQAAVVGAVVSIRNNATGYSMETKTDDRGAYELANIPPRVYDIKITASGFSTFEAKDITIAANNIARVDAPLKVGSVSEVITVGAEVARLQTDKSDIHADISSAQLTQISVAGYRNFQSLIDLLPGVTPAQFQNASTDSPARALTTNINGTARNSNNTRIDGAVSVFTWLPHHAFYIPPMESIDTVNISTNNFDAEQGMSGGAAVSVYTKSGTNDFHGVAFEYHANHKWGAKNLFFNPDTPAGPGTPQRIDNQFGGAFGGRIRRDKLFFFASWEATTTAERGNGLLSVPTAQVRSGDFNGLTTVYDPNTGDNQGRGRTPFANNLVPPARWSNAARTLQSMIPLPNTGSGQLNNFFASVPYYFKRNLVDGKLNWMPNSKMNIFTKYSAMIAPVSAQAPLGQALGAYHWQPEIGSWSPRGGFNFVNGVTGLNGGAVANNYNAYAAFLLGLPGSMGKAYQFYDPMRCREFQQGYYIRDNWQATRRLSVNLGMRFEHLPIMNRGEFGIERYDPDTNKVLIGGRGNIPRDADTEAIPVMFGPRVGFAYRLGDKTVLRAGYGITNDPYPMSRPMRSPYPAVISDDYNAVNSFMPAGSLATGIPAVKFPDLSTGIIDDIPNSVLTRSLQPGRFRRGYIESFNVTVQRDLGGGFVLQTGYAGTRSIRQALSFFEL